MDILRVFAGVVEVDIIIEFIGVPLQLVNAVYIIILVFAEMG